MLGGEECSEGISVMWGHKTWKVRGEGGKYYVFLLATATKLNQCQRGMAVEWLSPIATLHSRPIVGDWVEITSPLFQLSVGFLLDQALGSYRASEALNSGSSWNQVNALVAVLAGTLAMARNTKDIQDVRAGSGGILSIQECGRRQVWTACQAQHVGNWLMQRVG